MAEKKAESDPLEIKAKSMPAEPRKRGRPRKVTLEAATGSTADKKNVTVDDDSSIGKVLRRVLNHPNTPVATRNNGFERGQTAEKVVAGFHHEDQLMYLVKFKNRKLPDIISSAELRLRSPGIFIEYLDSKIRFPDNDE